MDIGTRRQYFKILKRWFDKLENPASVFGTLLDRLWFMPWLNEYEILERRIQDLETGTKFSEDDPSKLALFAMSSYANRGSFG